MSKCLIFIAAMIVAGSAQAKMRVCSMLELAEQSDIVFVGTVTAIGTNTASVTISEALSGQAENASIFVAPIHIQQCTMRKMNFSTGEQVLIFGNKAGSNQVTVAAGGQGKIRLTREMQEATVFAARKILTIAPLPEHEKNLAMLFLARSQNQGLRTEAHEYISCRLSHCNRRNDYKAELIALIHNSDPDIQRAGLQGIRFVQAEEAIPRIAELAHGTNMAVISAASMALGQYDTRESAAALIALTQHENPQIRMRAGIDINTSRRPEAKEALKLLLYDHDPKVRAKAPIGLVYWLRRNDADDVLPRLVELLDDPDATVRASAADKLGECRNSEMVPPLITALKQNQHDDNMSRSILHALYCHYSKGDQKAKSIIDSDIQLIVSALKNGGPHDAFGPSFQAVGILDLSPRPEAMHALRWAAESHSNQEIRAYAKRCL